MPAPYVMLLTLMNKRRLLNASSHSLAMIAVPILLSQNAAAFPLFSMAPGSDFGLQRRNHADPSSTDNTSSGTTTQVWVPILVITVVLAIAVIWTCTRKRWRERMAAFNWGRTTRNRAPATQGTRELTAEQLAGSINANATTTTASRNRRSRRPRRTPSQISTTSLPAYMKEPGEEELVIFRGPEDMEDAGMPTALVMPSVSEDGEDSMHSRDDSDPYAPMPHSPNDEPLLDGNDTSVDQSMLSENMPTRSVGSIDSPDEASSLMRVTSNDAPPYSPSPRGEAPPYFEAVDITEATSQNGIATRETPAQLPPVSPSSPPERAIPRRSGFRQLLSTLPNRLSMSHSTSHTPTPHTRADSSLSSVSANSNSHGRETSHGRPSHRPSPSGSGSFLSLAPFRTVSHQSNLNLNSPSMISLDSISAPLSHTLIRTEFTYPKSGPTPEQLKLISSREAFARFGMPYGADAIAYAASASRHDLDVPPPDFEVSDSEIPPVHSSSQAGPSRLRVLSNAADVAQGQEPTRLSREGTDASATNDIRPPRPSSPRAPDTQVHHAPETDSDNTLPSESENDIIPDTDSSRLPPPKSSSIPPSNSRPTDLETAAPSSYKAPHVTNVEQSKDSSVHTNTTTGLGLGMPQNVPSSYSRSVSRASSIQTFATAAESLNTDPSHSEPDDIVRSDLSEPTTPKAPSRPLFSSADPMSVPMGTEEGARAI